MVYRSIVGVSDGRWECQHGCQLLSVDRYVWAVEIATWVSQWWCHKADMVSLVAMLRFIFNVSLGMEIKFYFGVYEHDPIVGWHLSHSFTYIAGCAIGWDIEPYYMLYVIHVKCICVISSLSVWVW